jgi:hypothetical protein
VSRIQYRLDIKASGKSKVIEDICTCGADVNLGDIAV